MEEESAGKIKNLFAFSILPLNTQEGMKETPASPAVFTGSCAEVITGYPDQKHISTSFIERSYLTMRMSLKRFASLSNGFSK